MPDSEKLPPKLAWGKPFKPRKISRFKPVACFRCGTIKFNVKLMMQKRRAARMHLICAECGRKTEITVKIAGRAKSASEASEPAFRRGIQRA